MTEIIAPQEMDMRKGWNARADADPLWYILSNDKYRDAATFDQSGKDSAEIVLNHLDGFLMTYDSVLDIGCGNGRVLKHMKQFKERYGVDVSDEYIRQAERRDPSGFYQVMDGRHIPWHNPSFDLAYAMLLFEHFPAKQIGIDLIRETYRVLAPGGIFHLNIACAESGTDTGTSWNGCRWTAPELIALLKEAGFEILQDIIEPHKKPFTFHTYISRK